MSNITTTTNTILLRAIDDVIDSIATDGLQVLNRVLKNANFSKSEFLKNYELFAHVSDKEILFEIVLDIEAVLPENIGAEKEMQEQKSSESPIDDSAKTYHLSKKTKRVRRIRRSIRDESIVDSGIPLKDARQGSKNKLVKNDLMRISPRSMSLRSSGKVSIGFKRSLKISRLGQLIFPQSRFDTVIKDFINELREVIFEKFTPHLVALAEMNE